MKETINYKFKKIELQDSPPDITIHSDNFDIIDITLKKLENTIGDLDAEGIKLPDGTTISEKIKEITNTIGNKIELETADVTSLVAAINELVNEIKTHKAEKATRDELGHVKSDGETIIVSVDGEMSAFTESRYVEIGRNADTLKREGNVAIGEGAKNKDSAGGGSYGGVSVGSSTRSGVGGVALGATAWAEPSFAVAIGTLCEVNNSHEGVLGYSERTKKWIVPGSFTVNGTKNFEIPHPKPKKKATHRIRHGAVESPTAGDTLYRWKIKADKDNDVAIIDLPDYFIWLNKDVQMFVTPQGHFGHGYGELNREAEQLEIHCQYEGEYNVLVIGTRNDDHQSVQDWDIKGVEREIGESWTGETYVFSVDEIMEVEEIKEVV